MYLTNVLFSIFPGQDVKLIKLREAETYTKNSATSIEKFCSGSQLTLLAAPVLLEVKSKL